MESAFCLHKVILNILEKNCPIAFIRCRSSLVTLSGTDMVIIRHYCPLLIIYCVLKLSRWAWFSLRLPLISRWLKVLMGSCQQILLTLIACIQRVGWLGSTSSWAFWTSKLGMSLTQGLQRLDMLEYIYFLLHFFFPNTIHLIVHLHIYVFLKILI